MAPRALPGIQPLDVADWLIREEAFAGQMAERDRLLSDQRADVQVLDEFARPAAEELLDTVLKFAWPKADDVVHRSDGASVPMDRADPLGTLGRLVQEDFCILQKQGEEHVLTGARSTMRKARVALARRPAIILHAMMRDQTEFQAT